MALGYFGTTIVSNTEYGFARESVKMGPGLQKVAQGVPSAGPDLKKVPTDAKTLPKGTPKDAENRCFKNTRGTVAASARRARG